MSGGEGGRREGVIRGRDGDGLEEWVKVESCGERNDRNGCIVCVEIGMLCVDGGRR